MGGHGNKESTSAVTENTSTEVGVNQAGANIVGNNTTVAGVEADSITLNLTDAGAVKDAFTYAQGLGSDAFDLGQAIINEALQQNANQLENFLNTTESQTGMFLNTSATQTEKAIDATTRALSSVVTSTRSDLENTLSQLFKYAAIGGAIFAVVVIMRKK